MKLIEKVNAYKALCAIIRQEWDFDFAYKTVQLMRELEPDFEFFSNEEMKLIGKYGQKNDDGMIKISEDRSFVFADNQSAAAYAKEIDQLKQQEVGGVTRRKLIPPKQIRGELLAAIEPFFDFCKEEGASNDPCD